MPRANDWASKYGAKRRAIDRALLAECERRIDAGRPPSPEDAKEARERLAKAFGRPYNGRHERRT